MHNLSISDLNSIQFDEIFSGQLLIYVENGLIVRNYHLPDGAIAGSVEVSRERLRDDCCFGTLPEFIELLTSCGYQVIHGVNHG
ncbi:hypothetical protein ACIU3T_002157 [Escherichia coli]|nr:hypothetical protein [Escherichia coli]MCN6369943.1 hypothetical protein [Escherichia coli]MCX1168773.1 hypothetical protein [Escherichia coli]HEG2057066.1 hypothetical protein [Escherichia coli]